MGHRLPHHHPHRQDEPIGSRNGLLLSPTAWEGMVGEAENSTSHSADPDYCWLGLDSEEGGKGPRGQPCSHKPETLTLSCD